LGGDANVKKLNDFGIYPDPASNVSDLVLENVLNGRSGQIFVPKDQVRNSKMRTYPIWMQDALFGLMGLAIRARGGGKAFEFGSDDSIKLPG
jgi:all-trans-retinol dehydrogenase (NAD+)